MRDKLPSEARSRRASSLARYLYQDCHQTNNEPDNNEHMKKLENTYCLNRTITHCIHQNEKGRQLATNLQQYKDTGLK
jgi:hypothetical protein